MQKWTDLEKKQIVIENKYNPRKIYNICTDTIEDMKKDNSIIWTSVYDVIIKNIPDSMKSKDSIDILYWAEQTTINFIAKIMILDNKNTPIQSIIFAFVSDDPLENGVASVALTLEIDKESPVIKIKTGITVEGEDSVTVYPQLTMSLTMRQEIAEVHTGLPMLCKPRNWTNNHDGGYLTDACKEHIILGNKLKQHDKHINYEPLNYMQSIGFRINTDFTNNTIDEKEESLITVAGRQQRTGYAKNKKITQFYADANTPFYFIQQIDNRTRSYYKGFNINPQGYEYQKASLNFADEEELTYSGEYWVQIAIAGDYGLDGETFAVRHNWYNTNIKVLVDKGVEHGLQSVLDDMRFEVLCAPDKEGGEAKHLFRATVINYIKAKGGK